MRSRSMSFAVSSGAIVLGGLVAQAQATGSLQGTIRDAAGAVISGARLHLVDQNTGYLRDAISDGSGVFALSALLPGMYSVTISSPGFADMRREQLVVTVNRDLQLNFDLAQRVLRKTWTVRRNCRSALRRVRRRRARRSASVKCRTYR